MEIPAYPQTRPLHLSNKQLLDTLFRRLQPRVSELCFAGLYLFRQAHDYHLTMVGDAVVALGGGYDGRRYFLPPLRGDVPSALETLFSRGLELYAADEPFLAHHPLGAEFEAVEDRDSFDYLYSRDDLAALPGNRFHKKKNRINYFLGRHRHRTELYEKKHGNGCRQLLEMWREVASREHNPSLELEVAAAHEALAMADVLGLRGVVVSVEERIVAFSLGERLNRDTAVCHFEKTDPFMEGLAQLINREFAAFLFGECRFVNREQDLGIAGLRSAKLSYHPLELVKKYRVIP